MLELTEELIHKRVQAYRIQQEVRFTELLSSEEMRKLRSAAVMIPLLRQEGKWYVLLTHRSQNLAEHRGQVAFPGGARERQDIDLQATALREMQEEIGIAPQDVFIFGHLGDMPVVTGYLVRVFVGQVPWPYTLQINPAEVDSTYIVPLNWLADAGHRKVQYRSYAGREIPVIYFDDYEGHQLWGASAEMTIALLSALGLMA